MQPTKVFLFCLFISGLSGASCSKSGKKEMNEAQEIDWQGHRGARGEAPENSIIGFLKALEYPKVTTLEMDVAITKDQMVVLSHEPWLSPLICRSQDGGQLPEDKGKQLLINVLTYEELKAYDCGSWGHPQFPEQRTVAVYKPSLIEVAEAVRTFCKDEGRPQPAYNIEIKSRPEWDGRYTPDPDEFARILLQAIQEAGIYEQSCIQSFDPRALEAINRMDPKMTTALLVENDLPYQENLDRLSFLPDIYSPYHLLLNAEVVHGLHILGIKVIPWTVNEPERMQTLLDLGVDGIITDYPSRIP